MVYTREPSVPAKYKDRIKAAFAKANVDYGKFKEVDNSCKYVHTHGTKDGRTVFVRVLRNNGSPLFFPSFFLFGPPPTEPSPKPNLTRPPPHHHQPPQPQQGLDRVPHCAARRVRAAALPDRGAAAPGALVC